MTAAAKEKYSDEELEEIMDMHATDQVSVRQIRTTIRENPLLVTGLVFAFGLLLGLSMSSRRKSR
ncbi:MAG: hypothetical protein ABSF09_12735 [Candidatus Bathyarchaeia archaeon]|jgi:ElaB/YqjD/DUF883 family membrane-anchored ribosome-binding protein